MVSTQSTWDLSITLHFRCPNPNLYRTMMLESVAGWFTPTSLFLLLNIVIGTIWLTSLFGTHHKKHPHHEGQYYSSPPPLARAPSLIDRVKSINFGLYKYEHDHSDSSNDHEYFPSAEHVYANITGQKQPQPPLARAPSLLDRVKSIHFNDFQFSFFRSEFQHHPEPEVTRPIQPEHHSVMDPNSIQYQERDGDVRKSRVAEPERDSVTDVNPNLHQIQYQERDRDAARKPPLARAPSLLERVKSINFTDLHHFSLFRSESPIPEPEILRAEPEDRSFQDFRHRDEDHRVRRSKSDHPKGGGPRAAEKMKKSASEKMAFEKEAEDEEEVERRRPETTRVERTVSIGGDVEVDAKADDFINKFKHQLKLQRLDSILRYKDMITRGSSR